MSAGPTTAEVPDSASIDPGNPDWPRSVVAQIRDADVQQRIRGNPLQQVAGVPGLGKRNLFNPALDCGELCQQDQVLFTILAPGDLLFNRYGAQIVVGD